eukprot:Hpha_TRINITY_DN8647_c0_g1::TRINITY_DN8647_c0_g1_i1::g.168562::m.168562
MAGVVLSLPEGVQPVWFEGVLTSEFERETLPLLFASDEVFEEYYTELIRGHPHITQALEQVRTRNKAARAQKAEGFWGECLTTLAQCAHLRRCIFDDDDFQYTTAVTHYVLSVLNFASYFVKESRQLAGTQKDVLLGRAYDLFKRAEEATQEVLHPGTRSFLRAAVANNFANYFWRRGKVKAAVQHAIRAQRYWLKSKVGRSSEYFAMREAVAFCFQERWDAAASALTAAAEEKQAAEGRPPPVRFAIQLMASPLALEETSRLLIYHNLAVALVGQRKYRDAAQWSQRAVQAVEGAEQLPSQHPWVRVVRACDELCAKMSFAAPYHRYKMKPEESQEASLLRMHKAAASSESVPAFNSLLQMRRQKREAARKEQSYVEAAARREASERLQARLTVSARSDAVNAVYLTAGSNAGSPGAPKRTTRAKRPVAALKSYLQTNYAGYKQYIEELRAERRGENPQAEWGQHGYVQARQPPESRKGRELQRAREEDAAVAEGGGNSPAGTAHADPDPVPSPATTPAKAPSPAKPAVASPAPASLQGDPSPSSAAPPSASPARAPASPPESPAATPPPDGVQKESTSGAVGSPSKADSPQAPVTTSAPASPDKAHSPQAPTATPPRGSPSPEAPTASPPVVSPEKVPKTEEANTPGSPGVVERSGEGTEDARAASQEAAKGGGTQPASPVEGVPAPTATESPTAAASSPGAVSGGVGEESREDTQQPSTIEPPSTTKKSETLSNIPTPAKRPGADAMADSFTFSDVPKTPGGDELDTLDISAQEDRLRRLAAQAANLDDTSSVSSDDTSTP